jgi:CheY-like chemotaxis protein
MNNVPGTRGRILIIDDDTGFLELAEKMLAGQYEVSLAKSGKQALEYLDRGSSPDLILLDVDMPGMNGYETLKRIKALDGMETLPVVFLTGMTETE